MDIIVGKTAGFCFGVANAINKTKKELGNKQKVYCLGELVHNGEVTKELENEGVIFVNNIEDAKQNVIIRAHGEPDKTYKKAKELNLNVIDLTCPKVIKIHDTVKEYKKNGYYTLLIGKKDHPEIIGTISYCGKFSHVIEKKEDLKYIMDKINQESISKVLVISQTTFGLESFEEICDEILKMANKNIKIEIKNTICDATRLRQEETNKISKQVDLMIIIGGKHSSNTNKLYKIAAKNCKNSILIENAKELDLNTIKKFKKAGIMAGASTPEKSIKTVVEKLKRI